MRYTMYAVDVECVRIKELRAQVHTFHAVEDLSCNLYGGDDCRKTLVKENDILRGEHNCQADPCPNKSERGMTHTAALRAASEAPSTAIPQSAYSKMRLA
jgi:hypothetical protein